MRHPSETRCQRRCPIIFDLIACTHRRPSARPSQNPTTRYCPPAQPTQRAAHNIIHAQPALASTRSQRSSCRGTQAYHGGPVTSAASSFRDSVPATLPHLLRSDCLQAPTHLGPPLASPSSRYSPVCNRFSQQPATISMHSRRSQAPAHSAAHADAHKRTAEVQRRQLRHPSETRCQRRCPSCSDPNFCTHRRRRLAPRKPQHSLQPRAQPLQPATRNNIYAKSAFASTRSQHSCRRCTAYHRGSATSAASCIRDSVPATLCHHLRHHRLHTPPPLGSPLAIPITRYSPVRNCPINRFIHAPTAVARTRSRSCLSHRCA